MGEKTKQVAEGLHHRNRQRTSDLVRLTSLTPQVSHHPECLKDSIYGEKTNITKREKEIAALATSAMIDCAH